MKKQNRDFKGIWIPKNIWLDRGLTIQEKCFFIEIDSLDNENGCYASNDYFATFFNISKRRVTTVIKSLITKNYIVSSLIYKEGTKQIEKRILRVNKLTPMEQKFHTPMEQSDYTPMEQKFHTPMEQKFRDNNTGINNTIINNTREKLIFPYSSESFLKIWNQWKEYKKTEFGFKFKSKQSEQATLNKIAKITDTEEEATAVFLQSMAEGWKGLFKLKKDQNDKSNRNSEAINKAYDILNSYQDFDSK